MLFDTITNHLTNIIKAGSLNRLTDLQVLEREIGKWKISKARKMMIAGDEYYRGNHDILKRKRTVIGKDGVLSEVENLPNNHIVDNQYAKMVDQKVNYLVGKPLTLNSENTNYVKVLKTIINKKFARTLKNLCEDSLNGGLSWIHPYYNESGELCFKKFDPWEILPFWRDAEHTDLEFAIRLYQVEVYDGKIEKIIEKVEIYTPDGIKRYVLLNNSLVADVENFSTNYLEIDGKPYNWGKIPLIVFKYNNKEIPLIKRVKSLQDGINIMLSDFENNMQEDARNTILVIKNLDGQNLAEFRHNLATYGVVKVKTVDGSAGEVDTLTVEVNADNYKAILDLFKKALIENARGYDAKDEKLAGTPNQMNIQSMYNDIDLDANGMETEYQASFEELLWFINMHLSNTGKGNFENETVEIIFNRDMMMNESTVITDCVNSVGILSEESILSQHPWVTDVEKELKRVKEEKKAAIEEFNVPPDSGNKKPAF